MQCRIGILTDPRPDDTVYESQSDAEIAAIALSYCDSPIGVWDMEDDELMAIVYQQQVFWS